MTRRSSHLTGIDYVPSRFGPAGTRAWRKSERDQRISLDRKVHLSKSTVVQILVQIHGIKRTRRVVDDQTYKDGL
jgi:hypothetical protein